MYNGTLCHQGIGLHYGKDNLVAIASDCDNREFMSVS